MNFDDNADLAGGAKMPEIPKIGVQKSPHQKLDFGMLFAAFIAAFCFASAVEIILIKSNFTIVNFVLSVDILRFSIIAVLMLAFEIIAHYLLKLQYIIPYCLLVCAMMLAVQFSVYVNELYGLLGACFVIYIVVRWCLQGDKLQLSKIDISYRQCFIICTVLFAAYCVFISIGTIMRFREYNASVYDFGIFAQMFENMRKTGLPVTTLERNKLLSHFGVHFSPIFYLLLPGYMIFPFAEYLLVCQTLLVAGGVFAVYKIAKLLGASPKVTLSFAVIYLLYPAFGKALFYDFHENAFLSVLVLFTCYFMLKNNTPLTFVFGILTLTVKEDAAIYVIAIAAYMIVNQKKYLKGAVLAAISVVYFIGASFVVAQLGDGIMTSRLANYTPTGSDTSLLVTAKTIFFNIGYLVSQVFTREKLEFAVYMLLTVAFTPLVNKKQSVLLLLVPMVVINLLSNWVYQYDIGYQYVFGSGALIIFAAMTVIMGMKPKLRRTALALSLCFSVVLFMPTAGSKFGSYSGQYEQSRARCESTTKVLKSLPEGSITADTFIAAQLYKRDKLYMFPYNSGNDSRTEFLITDTRSGAETNAQHTEYMGEDYEYYDGGGLCTVYRLTDEARERLISMDRYVE